MADAKDLRFDPYHKWLGIPKDQRPPTYYQLLGLSRGESDREVIEEAAIRQSAHLRSYQTGPHADLCNRLLNEIGRAQQILLNPQKKKEYDERLANQSSHQPATAASQAIASKPMKAAKPPRAGDDESATFSPIRKPARKAASDRDSRQRTMPSIRKKKSSTPVVLLVGGIVGGLFAMGLFAAVAYWLLGRQQPALPRDVVAVDVDKMDAGAKAAQVVPPVKQADKPAIDQPQPAPKAANPNQFGPAAKFFGTWVASPQGSGLTRQLYLYQDAASVWHIHFTYFDAAENFATGLGVDAKFVKDRVFFTLVHDAKKQPDMPERIIAYVEFRGESIYEVLNFGGKYRSREYVRVNLPDSLRERRGSWHATLVNGVRLELAFDRLSEADSRGKLVVTLPQGKPAAAPLNSIRPYGQELAFDFDPTTFAAEPWNALTRGILTLKGGSPFIRFEGTGPSYEIPVSRDAGAPAVVGARLVTKADLKMETEAGPKLAPKSALDPVTSGVPPAAQIAAALKLIQEQFAKEYAVAKKSVAERLALADKLFKLARETTDDRPVRYVLFTETRDLASQAGNWSSALEAIEALRIEFGVDAIVQRDAAIGLLLKNSASKTAADEVAKAAIALIFDGIAADRVDIAQNALASAKSAASKSASAALAVQTKKLDPELKRLAQGFERMKKAEKALAVNAADPAAHLDLGRYFALHKAEWDRGLEHLAKGPLGDLSQAAKKDLESPHEANEQRDVGDLWWKQGDKETGWVRASLLSRAGYWYRQVGDRAAGLTRDVVAERLKKIDEAPSPFKWADPATALVEAKRFKGHTAAVTGIQALPEVQMFASSSLDGTIRTWDLASGKEVGNLNTTAPVLSFSVSPSQNFVAAVAKDRLRVFSWLTREPIVGPTEVIMPGAFWCGDDTLFFTRADGGYEQRNFYKKEVFGGKLFPVPGAVLSGSYGKQFYVSLGSDVRSFQSTFGGLAMRKKLAVADATCAAFFADGQRFILGSSDKRIRVFDARTEQLTALFEGPAGIPRALAISKDGRRVLSGGDDKIVRLWDAATAKEIARSAMLQFPVQAVAFTSGDLHALSAGADPSIQLWNLPRDKK